MEQLRFEDLPNEVLLLRQEIAELKQLVIDTTKANYVPDKRFTFKELADYLGKSVSAVRVYKRDGKIPFHQVGKAIYFLKSEIDEALKSKNNKRKFFK